MANVLRNGMDWLAAKLKQHAGESVVYSRGADSVAVTATLGKTLMRLDSTQTGGSLMEWTDADFLIAAEDLILASVAVEPERGDKIRWTKGGITRVFEVLAPGGEPCWRWSDEFQTVMRIHTKQVGTE